MYQSYIRPIVWAPIRAYRAYRDIRNERFYRMLAKQDMRHLALARQESEEWYAAEKEPLVSITTATYNRARILVDSTLPAVLAQSYKNIEWLIVGDHCTDNTADLLVKIDDPRVRFINLPKRPRYPRNKQKRWKVAGVEAINLAHDLARGSWVAHLDDDDVFTPDHIEKLLNYARASNYEMVAGISRLEMSPREWIERGRAVEGNGAWPQFSHSTVLYRSYLGSCFKYDARCLKVNAAGDGFRWRRMVNAGVRGGVLQEVVTLMPLRLGEASRSIFQPE
ncbi:MAG: glycosyltransferase family 2 protein [Nitrospiraceae bacterium]